MATLLDIRKRISTVGNIEKITRAMKMVAAARLRKAQERLFAARPYARHLRRVIRSLSGRVASDLHPLLTEHTDSNSAVLVIVTADRGLCGSFNASILRASRRFLAEHSDLDWSVVLIGRKAVSFYKHDPVERLGEWTDIYRNLDASTGTKIIRPLIDDYVNRRPRKVVVLYNQFKSAVAQNLVTETLLPFSAIHLDAEPPAEQTEYIYEPADPERVLTHLLGLHMEIQMFSILLESFSAEQAARMSAMGSATDNAVELQDDLTLHYNRVRQAGITKEISEIVGGAEALK